MSCPFPWQKLFFVAILAHLFVILSSLNHVRAYEFFDNFLSFFRIELCRKPFIEFNRTSFDLDLTKFHGQPIAKKIVPVFYEYHYSHQPLCFYFHGNTGLGKTYLTDMIIKNTYKFGMDSIYVHYYHLDKDYSPNKISDMEKIFTKINSLTILCDRLFVVFDGYSESWQFILSNIKFYKTRFKKSVFIFLSNTDTQEINKYFQLKKNKKNLLVYETLLDEAKKKRSLLWEAMENLIYVPFLPMVYEDVRQCTIDWLNKLNSQKKIFKIDEKIADLILLSIKFEFGVSVSGCKMVPEKTALYLKQKTGSIHQEF